MKTITIRQTHDNFYLNLHFLQVSIPALLPKIANILL